MSPKKSWRNSLRPVPTSPWSGVYLMVRPANKNHCNFWMPGMCLTCLTPSELGPSCRKIWDWSLRVLFMWRFPKPREMPAKIIHLILGFSHGFSHGISSQPAIIGVTPMTSMTMETPSPMKRSSCCSALFSSWSKLPQPEIQMVLGWVSCSPLIVVTMINAYSRIKKW